MRPLKRYNEVIYGDTAPEPQAAIWLKRIGTYTCIPYINDNGKWVKLTIKMESNPDTALTFPVYYLNTDDDFNTLAELMTKAPEDSYAFETNNISTDLLYLYVAIYTNYTFEAVNADFPSDVLTEDFKLVDQGNIKVGKKTNPYKLYKYVLLDGQGNPMALETPVNLTVYDG